MQVIYVALTNEILNLQYFGASRFLLENTQMILKKKKVDEEEEEEEKCITWSFNKVMSASDRKRKRGSIFFHNGLERA